MEKSKILEIILAEWVASLKSKDRSYKSVKPNFEELFEKWRLQEAAFSDLYDVLLQKAIKAHQPSPPVIKASFLSLRKKLKSFSKSEKEFTDEWNRSIADTATEAFFEFFPPQIESKIKEEPPMFGNMSAKEYKAQRKYADQFPILDTSELEQRLKDHQYGLDLEDMFKHVLGDEK